MKKIIISMFIVLGGATFAAPAFADDTKPSACAISSEGDAIDCPIVDSTYEPIDEPTLIDEPMPIDAPVCTEEDMSACQRGGGVLYDEAPVHKESVIHQSGVANDSHEEETWWDIFTDRSHIRAELGWTILEDVIIIGLLYKFVFKRFLLPRLSRKIHADIDREHGIEHN